LEETPVSIDRWVEAYSGKNQKTRKRAGGHHGGQGRDPQGKSNGKSEERFLGCAPPEAGKSE
jgi:hypothetical protein